MGKPQYNDNDESFLHEEGEGEVLRLVHKSSIRDKLDTFYNSIIIPKLGICFALLSQLFGSVMSLSGKLIEQDQDFPEQINPFEIILIRMILTSVCTVTYSIYTRPKDFPMGSKNIRIYLIIRTISGFFGIYLLYFALQYISLSASTVINFMNPVLTLIFAYFLLGEKYTIYETIGGIFSLIGVILVVQPSFLFSNPTIDDHSGIESSDPKLRTIGLVVAFIGCFANATTTIALRFIGKRCDPVVTVQFFSVGSGIIAAIALFLGPGSGFQKLTTTRQWYLFIQLGVSGFFTQFFWTCAIAREKAGRIVLLGYFGMIYTIFWEIVIWGHFPTFMSIIGFLIVVASTAAIIYLKPNVEEENDAEDQLEDIEQRLSEEFKISDDEYDDDDDDDEHDTSKDTIEMTDMRLDDNDSESSSSRFNSVK